MKAGDGTWTHGQGGDGRFRNGVHFEPVCNCPGTGSNWGTIGITGQEEKLFSESWLGAVSASMLDVLVFIEEGTPDSEAVRKLQHKCHLCLFELSIERAEMITCMGIAPEK